MAPYLVGVLDAREAPVAPDARHLAVAAPVLAAAGPSPAAQALIGLNVQHDANHGAMFKDGRKNALWGLAQSWIGGSQLMWLQERVVLHHMHTGDVEFDPDAQLAPVMRGHAGAPWLPWMRFQQFYFLLVELGYGVIPMFMSFFEVLCWRHKFERKFALSRLAHYPHIAPVVRAFCERHGAPYVHFDSVGANLASVFAYLAKFSSPDYDAPVPKPEGPKAD
ncbi:hypothetical protein JL720_10752 [Aureococcus anophagefferens]|nr:hypothetical protein JL720_10752 [Aureococcus anophagefferens]